MSQANTAEIVRVYTRQFEGTIEDLSPTVSAGSRKFEVIVEAEAGTVRAGNGSPYTISLTAFDITEGQNAADSISAAMKPEPLKQNFQTTTYEDKNNVTPWPAYEQKFVIALDDDVAKAAVGHVCQYTAKLQTLPGSSDPIVSITQSNLFTLV